MGVNRFTLEYTAAQFVGIILMWLFLYFKWANPNWIILAEGNWFIFCYIVFNIYGYKYRIIIPEEVSDNAVNLRIRFLIYTWLFLTLFLNTLYIWSI